MYSAMLDWPRDKIVSFAKSFETLDEAVAYVNEQNEILRKEWQGDSKIFFIQKNGTQEWSLDGKDWKIDTNLIVIV